MPDPRRPDRSSGADPFDALATPIDALSPDPDFATALRDRVAAALARPQGATMSDSSELDLSPDPRVEEMLEPSLDRRAEGFPRPGALPYLTVRGAQSAIDFYVEAFGARLVGEPIRMPDGRIGHSELAMGGGVVYLAEEYPELGLRAPQAGATSVSLMLPVADADAALARALRAGATLERPPSDNHGRRGAVLVDPFGHRWMLSAPVPTRRSPTEPVHQGDIVAVTWRTPDAERAERFYRAVLGWSFSATAPRVRNVTRAHEVEGGHDTSALYCCFAVDDVQVAVRTVRAAGGTAEAPEHTPGGLVARCTDVQGTPFAVQEQSSREDRPPLTGTVTGDLCYVTFRPRGSSAPVRDFYRRVLGWTLVPGQAPDGWEPVGVHPMAGMAGGGDGATVPMWKAVDVPAAVDRVRAAGGTVVAGPERQPYGVTAECLDDQGGRFYLGDV
ncbi:VOC family protein [Rhodococcus sp. X156]|uniref:VOC family protein n=1 Tax=Rhodococcus sp. X156 TaxID=2499145 RepID=UPI001F494A52|nr:VOC family protein [Rhodococcus sp. X156]